MVDTGGKKPAAYGGAEVVPGAHPSIFGNRECGSETVCMCRKSSTYNQSLNDH